MGLLVTSIGVMLTVLAGLYFLAKKESQAFWRLYAVVAAADLLAFAAIGGWNLRGMNASASNVEWPWFIALFAVGFVLAYFAREFAGPRD